MKKFYISLFVLSTTLTGFAQEEAEACQEPNKKVMKLINAAKDAKDTPTAVTKFNEAIAMDDENATAYYEFGWYAYQKAKESYRTNPNPKAGDKSLAKAEEMFLATIDACEDYHSNAYYYLAIINYTQKDMESATKWFKEFLKYNHNDPSKYAADHTARVAQAKKVVGDLEYENEILNNEVPFDYAIVKHVSTSTDEYFPMISPDNELIFFTRKANLDTTSDVTSDWREMFTVSKRPDMKSEFSGGAFLTAPFNDGSVASYGASTLSVDNKEMIICACKKEEVFNQPYMNCDLYTTTYTLGGYDGNQYIWSELENLGDKINTSNGWEGQPSVSADGNTLYYTANRETTQDNDIFISRRQPDGSWGPGRPFSEINTEGKDKSPFLHQDSETLYFVSEATKDRPGVGGLDIYFIRQNEDGSWTEPQNIGYPINSKDDELGLFVSIDGSEAYFSSRQKGYWNIYSFELYEDARPQSVALIKGELKDESGGAVEDATIEIAYEGTDEVTEVKVNGNDGKYAAIVKTKKNQDVMVTVKKKGHAFDSKLIAKEDLNKEDIVIRDKNLDVKKLEVGAAYTINDILYATNSAQLNDRSKFILKGFARFLKENPSIKVSIQGHTDDVGNDQKNMELSERRAKGVKDFLATQGIDKSRLTSKGFGETKPKVENNSEENRAQNRRTDFVIDAM